MAHGPVRPIGWVAALCMAATACSAGDDAGAAQARKPAGAPHTTPAAAKPPAPAGTSRILGKRDFVLRGAPACDIRYVYAGHDPETLFWEEPCASVTAMMVTRPELEKLGKWSRLDSFAQKFVTALPGGQVLYVEGGFSASVYPIGTTGQAYEVSVAD